MSIAKYSDSENQVDTAFEFDRTFEPYNVRSFTESEDPGAALRVQRMQGESYARFGYLEESILVDGCLPEELDHSRGENITYFHASANPYMPEFHGEASGRLVNGAFESLFVSGLDITPENRQEIINQEREGRVFRELGAISLTEEAVSLASFCIVREVVQRSIRANSNDVILGSQTAIALKGFKATFGPNAVRDIGRSKKLYTGSNQYVELTPVSSDMKSFLSDVLVHIQSLVHDDKRKDRLVNSLVFITDGLLESERPDSVNKFLESINK